MPFQEGALERHEAPAGQFSTHGDSIEAPFAGRVVVEEHPVSQSEGQCITRIQSP